MGRPEKKRAPRADAQRSMDALLDAAKEVFGSSGVDAPVREIATRAGVGLGTVYRHFPQRSDLVVAVFRREVDSCAAAAKTLARRYEPFDALIHWLRRYTAFIATKRGLAAALHSGDTAFAGLPEYFRENLEPALQRLLDDAIAAGQIRDDIGAYDLLVAVANLSSSSGDQDGARSKRLVDLLIDGLRYRAPNPVAQGKR